ncbi:hypothetical protein CALCODRAFT_511924 [Calocera cornea HHB12733]|uniref:Protein kinase domain-containing protein n=1 Tax=Calocera cornea HHB12733 TaxID=1353952 RepID=A0A165DF30_9BASI|nr:hypothetical protein CALCODRAFT_511924 [Calocera cornea HHB12733]
MSPLHRHMSHPNEPQNCTGQTPPTRTSSLSSNTLSELSYLHSANLRHRDVKPHSLLANADCELMMCDSDPARAYRPHYGPGAQYGIAGVLDGTSWGRLHGHRLHRPAEANPQNLDALHEETLRRVTSTRPRILHEVPALHAITLAIHLPNHMLCFKPAKRISSDKALAPYLHVWHDAADEPVCFQKLDSGLDNDDMPPTKTLVGTHRSCSTSSGMISSPVPSGRMT